MDLRQIERDIRSRDRFINKFIDDLSSRIERYQDKLYDMLEEFAEYDEIEELILDLEKELDEDKEFDMLVFWWDTQVDTLIAYSNTQYANQGLSVADTESEVAAYVNTFKPTLEAHRSDIKNFLVAMVLSGVPNRKDALKDFIKPQDKKGAVYNSLMPQMRDTALTIGRYVDVKNAQENELVHALYTGGLIETSRCFCEQRDGKIFSLDTINSWNDLEWKGKMEGVDVKVALGGWNCRHTLAWVDQEIAQEEGFDPEVGDCE